MTGVPGAGEQVNQRWWCLVTVVVWFMTGPSGLAVVGGVGADPGGQDAVGMVDEVVAGEGVDTVGVAGDVGDGDRDDLAVARRVATPAARCSRSPGTRANSAAATMVVTSSRCRPAR